MKNAYSIKKRPPQQVWYYKLSHEKTYHSTGEKSKAKALQYVLNRIANPDSKPTQTDITVKEFCKNFFVWNKCQWIKRTHDRGKSFGKHIAQMRRGHLENHVFPVLGNRTLKSLRVTEMDIFFDNLQLSNQTKNHILSTLSIVFKEAQRNEVIDRSPLDSFEPFVNDAKPRDILTEDEERILFPANPDEAVKIWGSVQYATIFSLLHTTGARLGEIAGLTWADFTKAVDGTIYIYKALKNDKTVGETKTGKMVFVPYIEPCISLIAELKKLYMPKDCNDLAFLNTKNLPIDRGVLMAVWKRVLQRNSIPLEGRNLVIHSLRHGFNTKVKQHCGGDVVRLMTGHSSEKMTKRYDHPDLEKERKKVSIHVKEIDDLLNGQT